MLTFLAHLMVKIAEKCRSPILQLYTHTESNKKFPSRQSFSKRRGGKKRGESGSEDNGIADEAERYEVRVWDLGTLECEHTLPQPAEEEVNCLAAGCGAVWGGVGREVVVWGRV